jgi:hypothetical protein
LGDVRIILSGSDDLSDMKAAVASLFLLVACVDGPEDLDPIDGDEDVIELGKGDGSCLESATSDDARGVLMLANDPEVSGQELDELGLNRRTAYRIAESRPYATLAELDAVPTVGPVACRVLRASACDLRGLCERKLSLWTWNIEHFPLSGSAVDLVAQTIQQRAAENGVEIIGFEEVDTLPAWDALMGKLPGWASFVGVTGFDTRVTLAYRADRLTVVGREDLFVGDPDRFPRPPLAVTFEVKGRLGASRLTVVVVHLKAMIDLESRDRRRRAILALDEWMARRRELGQPVVVVGDWNDDIDAPADRNVFAPLLGRPDAYAPLTLDPAQRREYSYLPFRRLIDHIVATADAARRFPALAVDPVKLDETIPGYATAVSDHRPVRADLVPIIPR